MMADLRVFNTHPPVPNTKNCFGNTLSLSVGMCIQEFIDHRSMCCKYKQYSSETRGLSGGSQTI
jgi:hypothetical protein